MIFWDGYGLDKKNSGVFRHAQHLKEHLVKDLQIPIALLGTAEQLKNFDGVEPFLIKTPAALQFLLTNKFVWSNYLYYKFQQVFSKIQGHYVIHGLSNFNIPIVSKRSKHLRTVITVHDLIPLIVPAQVSPALALQAKLLLPKVFSHADTIICVSQWTRRTLLEHFPKMIDKSVVIGNGFLPYRAKTYERQQNDKKSTKVLFVSRYEKYKNFDLVLKVLAKAKEKLSLTIVTDELGRKFIDQQDHFKNARNLSVLTNLVHQQLLELYREHDVYFHPSKFEGFCLPAMEALSFGIPVVYLEGSGIDEVVGKIGGIALSSRHYLDDWIQAIEQASHFKIHDSYQKNLEQYLNLKPSWQEVAIKTNSIYNELLS